MFQFLKRANFISKNNFSHSEMGDLVHMHLWLQKHGWPANEFVDLYMRCHTKFEEGFDDLSFKCYMCDQFDWVYKDDVDALHKLFERIDDVQYRGVDNDNLIPFVYGMVKGSRSRGADNSRETLNKSDESPVNPHGYVADPEKSALAQSFPRNVCDTKQASQNDSEQKSEEEPSVIENSTPDDFHERMSKLHNIAPSDTCGWPGCEKKADSSLSGVKYCLGHYWEAKAKSDTHS